MIFQFLRKIFTDNAYLALESRLNSLEQEMSLLKSETSKNNPEKSIDLEYISLIWVVVGIIAGAMVFIIQASLNATNRLASISILRNYYSLIDQLNKLLTLCALIYSGNLMYNQISFGLDLLRQYSEQKQNNSYLKLTKQLRWVFLLFLVFLCLFIAGKLQT